MTYIYSLLDPRDRKIRYVGRTKDIDCRLAMHLESIGQTGMDLPVTNWIRKIVAEEGVLPIIEVLEKCESNGATEELMWIRRLKNSGIELLNVEAKGREHSSETRKKMSDEWHSHHDGQPNNRTSESYKPSRETRTKISESKKAMKWPVLEDTRKLLSQAGKNRGPVSPEEHQRRSEAAKQLWKERKKLGS